ncbi:MAG: LysR substrate-binding domain-containing protein [Akkermansiaceae bacterium]|jgi:DNA-binding transcriptional LysR family regulator|nr:LysR substrate-binding domain-containing protein [Akkermansiaceae bacterium]MDP4646064.1 LysR substrate-binding domain-containing protein [Akkermansiaceae bacterium]MDP4720863.1 LysR substrate-binding domain-containing protein [Akkermansiaceae bacterium]MDP4780778.1 LysR substrate-binding domain-containing protein [Akkermansiaceae bacterium]MDP4845724.1 LysR substrate-binding domain-containing protein [Akkermansiaceae bacterium]
MEFHQLRYFVAAAEELSISKAAERVHVSQPAMSRQIRLLEEEMELQLFDRIKQRIHLTEAGKFFLIKARQLLCDSELAVQQAQEKFGGVRRTLRLGFLSPFLDDLIAPVVREFQQRHQGSKVSLFDLPPRAQLDRLGAHELDACILANLEDADMKRFSVKRLSRNRFIAVLPDKHRLAGRKSVKLAELAVDDWVSLSNTFFPKRREFLTETCETADFSPRIVAEMDSLPMMLAEIGTGGGVGVMPGHAAKLPHAGCILVKLSSPAIHSDLLLVREKSTPTPEMETLIALISERAAGI